MGLDVRPATRASEPAAGNQLSAGNRRWLVIGLAGAAALAVLIGLTSIFDAGGPSGNPTTSVRGRLAADLTAQLEKSTPAEHAAHGHDLGTEPGRVLCTAEVYGYEPANASTVDQVTKAYGYHLCAIGSKEFVWDTAPKLVGPLVVDYATKPPTVQVVESGEGYPQRLASMIPPRYQDQARHGFTDGKQVADLRARYDTVIPKA